MFCKAKNQTVACGGMVMDYAVFGDGVEPLVILPGLSDGLRTVRGRARRLALSYRAYAKRYRVYVFSRRRELPAGATTRDMARDQAAAMRALGIGPARVMGISEGGMVAQYLAIDAPELVSRLVLAVSLCHPNDTLTQTIPRRIALARAGDYHAIVADTVESSASPALRRLCRPLCPLLGRFGAPQDFSRFITHAEACLTHDSRAELSQIACPTLVIGGGSDANVGPGSSRELAAHIPGSALHVYPALGHAAFLEARDFPERVFNFLDQA